MACSIYIWLMSIFQSTIHTITFNSSSLPSPSISIPLHSRNLHVSISVCICISPLCNNAITVFHISCYNLSQWITVMNPSTILQSLKIRTATWESLYPWQWTLCLSHCTYLIHSCWMPSKKLLKTFFFYLLSSLYNGTLNLSLGCAYCGNSDFSCSDKFERSLFSRELGVSWETTQVIPLISLKHIWKCLVN